LTKKPKILNCSSEALLRASNMEMVPSSRRDLDAAHFTSTPPQFGICERKGVGFNSLLPSARTAAQGELDSFKIAPVNGVEDSILLETYQSAGRTQGLLDQYLFGACFVAPFFSPSYRANDNIPQD
jgi:hypothetical protein